jgi:hypothetical protein
VGIAWQEKGTGSRSAELEHASSCAPVLRALLRSQPLNGSSWLPILVSLSR